MADKDFVIKHGLVVGGTATINGVQIDPSGANSGEVLKFDGNKFVSGTATSSAGQSLSYEETIGNNSSTSFTVTHSLGTKDLNVIVRENVSPYDVVDVRWEATSANTVTVDFGAAPSTDSKRIIIKGPGTKDFYSETIGDGSNTVIVVNHNLGSRNIVPVLRNVNFPYEVVEVLAQATTIDSVTFDFSLAPSSSSLVASFYLLDVDNSSIFTIGDGSTREFTVTHNLNTRDIGVTCRLISSPYDFTSVRWEALTVNTAKVIFSSPPTTNSRKIGIYTELGGSKPYNDEVTLDVLDDVSITSVSNGQFLGWNGTNWVNLNAPGGASINSLDDIPGVTISSPLSNEVLQWNGTAWINASGYATLAAPTFTGNVSGITKTMVGLGSVDNTADTAKPVSTAQQTALDLKANIASPTFTGNVSGITKTMIGLGSVDNTADTAKPVSTAQQTALDLKANLASPTFTGNVSGITKTMIGLGSVDDTADTAKPVSIAQQTALDLKANLASPALTGTPTAPTATAATNTTQIATTAFVRAEVAALVNSAGSTLDTLGEIATALGNDANLSTTLTTSIGLKAPLASPTFTGTVTIPTGASITAPTGLVKGDVGLGNVDNTSNATERAATATLTNKTLTSPVINTPTGIVKGDVGLGSVDNTADIAKPVSTAQQTALDLKANIASPTFTGTATTSNLTVNGSLKITTALEIASVSATSATGTINIDFLSNPVVYYTANATANWTLNVRGNSSTTMNTVMSTGDVATVTFMAQQGATAYYPTVYQIDGTAVTPKWQGGTAPTSGNASSIDTYAVTVVKTAANTYTAFASQTKFA